jgi:hypothetical protein
MEMDKRPGVLKHHAEMFDDWIVLLDEWHILPHLEYLRKMRLADGTPQYPGLQTKEGIVLREKETREMYRRYFKGELEIIERGGGGFARDGLCRSCSNLEGERCILPERIKNASKISS